MTTSAGGVGEVERNRARGLLDERWRAGRLEPGEHERRVTLVRHALTEADLDAALHGLAGEAAAGGSSGPVIAPYEPQPSGGATVAQAGPLSADPDSGEESERTEGLLRVDRKTAYTLVSLTPLICLALIVAFDVSAWIFLAIPIVSLVLFGKEGTADAHSERRALRHARKARRHQLVAEKHRDRRRGR